MRGNMTRGERDDLELLRADTEGIHGVEFHRYAQCSFEIAGRPKLAWVLPPSRQSKMWRVCFSGEQPRHEFETRAEVVAWLRDARQT